MIYLTAASILAIVLVAWRYAAALEQQTLVAAQERREALDAYDQHIAGLLNRIQQPERASQVSISHSAPDAEPQIDLDLAEEMSILESV